MAKAIARRKRIVRREGRAPMHSEFRSAIAVSKISELE